MVYVGTDFIHGTALGKATLVAHIGMYLVDVVEPLRTVNLLVEVVQTGKMVVGTDSEASVAETVDKVEPHHIVDEFLLVVDSCQLATTTRGYQCVRIVHAPS